ncbi:MAG: biosynthetic-type acetolactate synthase large subunit [Thermoanaerobaculia bacterium]|nr:biosynthetic-type acetolactate synthase large subunit [Thermoanaerobaculia bacterium]
MSRQARRSGADIVWEGLSRHGVDRVFGYPGGAILPTYDALDRHPGIHHVLCRHEQGATHMADGYARASGRPGVVLATSGPGATNLVTGLGTAMMDSSPVVCITGQVPTTAMGGDAFQECDTTGVAAPVTKHAYLVREVDDLPLVLDEALTLAVSGRPGPVLVDIPKDVQNACTEAPWPDTPVRLPGSPQAELDPDTLKAALDLIESARRPVILAGHGILLSGASDELLAFAERRSIPVALTLLGKGCLPEAHPLCLGMMGMHGTAPANRAIQEADLLLAFGMRFDDRVTGNLATYAPSARKLHIDIDAAEIGKNVAVDVGIVGDLRPVLSSLLEHLAPLNDAAADAAGEWRDEIASWTRDADERDVLRRPQIDDSLLAAEVIDALFRHTGGDVINVTDVGQHQMWEAQYYPHSRPGTLVTSGGMGTMGFALPAALGVKMARPDEEVWAIAGDGGFQMTQAELATAVQEGIELKVTVINNGYLGMVRQWQEFFYDRRYLATPVLSPDFCRLAEAYGIPALRVSRREDLGPAIDRLRAHRGGPILAEFVVEQHDAVYPMVPAGADLDAMIRRPHPDPRPNPEPVRV